MTLSQNEPVNFRINLKITGNCGDGSVLFLLTYVRLADKSNRTETLFLVVRTHTVQGMFGVDPATLETVSDSGETNELVCQANSIASPLTVHLLTQDLTFLRFWSK